MRPLAPVEKRIALLVASRTWGMAWLLAFTAFLALVSLKTPFSVDLAVAIIVMFLGVPLVLAPRHQEMGGPGAVLWLQKPVRELRFVFARLAESMGATVVLVVLLALVAMAYGDMLEWQPPRPLDFVLPVGVLASLVTASMAFGAAAWLPRGSRTTVVALILLSLYAYAPEMSDPDLVRGGVAGAARLVLFPMPDLLRVVLGITGDLSWRIQPLLACLAYAAGWIAVGALGVLWSVTAGRVARA